MKKKVWISIVVSVAVIAILAIIFVIIFNKPSEKYEEYNEAWLSKSEAFFSEEKETEDLIINEIYADCFIAQNVYPTPWHYKINGDVTEVWCVGDQVSVTIDNVYTNRDNFKIEADLIDIGKSDLELEDDVAYKPVIYLYPQKETNVTVKLDLNGELTCAYPEYKDGWKVIAQPDGTLKDQSGISYNYLYWEGETYTDWDMSKGFCVKGEDTAKFLENALESLGLTRREANEFIVYWLPLMQENPYNLISFQTKVYADSAQLEITPTPDTLIRVFMAYKPLNEFIDIEPQDLSSPKRVGFTAVEWGGTKID